MIRMKSIIKTILSIFGVGIYRLTPSASGGPIDSLSRNTVEWLDKSYSDPENIKRYITPGRIAFWHSIIKLCRDKGITLAGRNIADLGCGTGYLLELLGKEFNDVTLTGFEYSDAAIKVAETICPIATFLKSDMYQYAPQRFDVVFCTQVLEHLLYPDKALKNCLKFMDNGGTLIITVPNGRMDTFLGSINFWSPESWKVFIEINCEGLWLDIGLIENGNNYAIIR